MMSADGHIPVQTWTRKAQRATRQPIHDRDLVAAFEKGLVVLNGHVQEARWNPDVAPVTSEQRDGIEDKLRKVLGYNNLNQIHNDRPRRTVYVDATIRQMRSGDAKHAPVVNKRYDASHVALWEQMTKAVESSLREAEYDVDSVIEKVKEAHAQSGRER